MKPILVKEYDIQSVIKYPKSFPKGGLYYAKTDDGWMAVDNTTQEAFTETFEKEEMALYWLSNEYATPTEAREKYNWPEKEEVMKLKEIKSIPASKLEKGKHYREIIPGEITPGCKVGGIMVDQSIIIARDNKTIIIYLFSEYDHLTTKKGIEQLMTLSVDQIRDGLYDDIPGITDEAIVFNFIEGEDVVNPYVGPVIFTESSEPELNYKPNNPLPPGNTDEPFKDPQQLYFDPGEPQDDITHPDGSDSKIPYWVRIKLGELDTLSKEIYDYFHETQGIDSDLIDDLTDNLNDLQSFITNIQEGEGWI